MGTELGDLHSMDFAKASGEVRKLHQEVKKKEWDVTLVDSSQGSDTEERDFGKLQSLHWFASIILFLSAILFPGSTLLRVKATSRVTLQGQQDNTATTDLERKLLWKFALDKFFYVNCAIMYILVLPSIFCFPPCVSYGFNLKLVSSSDQAAVIWFSCVMKCYTGVNI